MANVQTYVLIFLFLLTGTLSKVVSEKWSYFHTGCDTLSGRILSVSNLHLLQCTAECNVIVKCKVFGYSSSDKLCFLFDESFSTANTHSCISKTTRFYTIHNTTMSYVDSTTVPVTTTNLTNTSGCGNATAYTYVASLNKCIRYHSSDKHIWDDARQVCEQDGGHLVYVKTQAVLDYIRSFQETDNTKYWIGGKQSQAGSTTFEWLNGVAIDNTNGGQLWLENRPAVDNPTYNYCMETKTPQNKTLFGFFDRQCSSVRKFFCEVDVI